MIKDTIHYYESMIGVSDTITRQIIVEKWNKTPLGKQLMDLNDELQKEMSDIKHKALITRMYEIAEELEKIKP